MLTFALVELSIHEYDDNHNGQNCRSARSMGYRGEGNAPCRLAYLIDQKLPGSRYYGCPNFSIKETRVKAKAAWELKRARLATMPLLCLKW